MESITFLVDKETVERMERLGWNDKYDSMEFLNLLMDEYEKYNY